MTSCRIHLESDLESCVESGGSDSDRSSVACNNSSLAKKLNYLEKKVYVILVKGGLFFNGINYYSFKPYQGFGKWFGSSIGRNGQWYVILL